MTRREREQRDRERSVRFRGEQPPPQPVSRGIDPLPPAPPRWQRPIMLPVEPEE